MANNIAAKWRSLSGIEDNWEKLIVDPIDNDLRQYLVHYGQRVVALADSFNDMKITQGFGLSLFPPDELFTQTCLEIGNPFKYQVTDLIYARSGFDIGRWHEGESAYMGYVAVVTDEGKRVLGRRDILVCWRGTLLDPEEKEDFDFILVPAHKVFGNSPAKVHQGFLDIYTRKTTSDSSTDPDPNKEYTRNSAREQVLAAVRKHVDNYTNTLKETVSITVAGHSLGAAIATLNSMDIVSNGYNKPTGSETVIPVTAFVYASPRVGNKDFLELFSSLPDLHLLSIRNAKDIVHQLPPSQMGYEDVGTMLDIDVINSEDMNDNIKSQPHNLHVYIYAIASYQGKDKKSKLEIDFDFDIAYVNKDDDLLVPSLMVPKRWFQSVVRHGMVQMDNTGKWKVRYDYIPPLPPLVPHIPPN